ncbi:uncharacterized protein BJX67DRAFT_372669 [Aspergillus lucknowensis]|uniref:Uncharacterized protein n=1 Tax=Aspergillus lucknowensis TaxID=176173 RepID=A0ABR4LNV7_9EURO
MALTVNPLIALILPTEICYASPNSPRYAHGGPETADGFTSTDLRAGGPQLCEAPCESWHKIPYTIPHANILEGRDSYRLLTKLGDICRLENIFYSELHFCGRRSVYEQDADPTVTLLIVTRPRRAAGSPWASGSVSMEILDQKFGTAARIYPCLPTDEIFPIWEQVATAVFPAIDCQVLLGVDRRVKRDWKELRDTVATVLDAHGLGTVAAIVPNDNLIATRGHFTPSDTGAMVEDCSRESKLGVSLSAGTTKDGHGTLGGWVELQNPQTGDWLPFAITCSRCCFPAEEGLPAAHFHAVHYRDVKNRLDALADQITANDAVSDYREVEELRAKDEFVKPLAERVWKMTATALEQNLKDRQHLKEFFHQHTYMLGNIFAAPGLRDAPSADDPTKHSIRDWALGQPCEWRTAPKENLIVRSAVVLLNPSQLSFYFIGCVRKSVEQYEVLCKVGRGKGFTDASYGNLKSCNVSAKVINGQEAILATWEHVLMLFGGAGCQDLGYFTATRDLHADTQDITGVTRIRLR